MHLDENYPTSDSIFIQFKFQINRFFVEISLIFFPLNNDVISGDR